MSRFVGVLLQVGAERSEAQRGRDSHVTDAASLPDSMLGFSRNKCGISPTCHFRLCRLALGAAKPNEDRDSTRQ